MILNCGIVYNQCQDALRNLVEKCFESNSNGKRLILVYHVQKMMSVWFSRYSEIVYGIDTRCTISFGIQSSSLLVEITRIIEYGVLTSSFEYHGILP